MTVGSLVGELCACPVCHGDLAWGAEAAQCASCGRRFESVNGIPVLSAPADDYKRTQAAFFDAQPASWEATRPHGAPALYAWLMAEKFRRSLRGLETILPGATVLTVCGGSGMDAEFLARAGARVIASDISPGAALRVRERAERHGVEISPIVADAEALPFKTGSIDVVYVHDGLHHLEDPMAGLREMTRVARVAVSLTEPARARATALAVRLGISEDEEEAGNRVERLDPEAVVGQLRASAMDVIGVDRYAMYYRHEPGPMVRALSRGPLLGAAKAAFALGNLVLGPVGNKLTVRALHGSMGRESSFTEAPTPAPGRTLR